jgi:hypothetical protein
VALFFSTWNLARFGAFASRHDGGHHARLCDPCACDCDLLRPAGWGAGNQQILLPSLQRRYVFTVIYSDQEEQRDRKGTPLRNDATAIEIAPAAVVWELRQNE